MRFLFGLFTGAVLTLLVATAMDAPTHPVVNGARDLAIDAWDHLIDRTSDSLFDTVDVARADAMAYEEVETPVIFQDEVIQDEAGTQQTTELAPTPALPPPEPIEELPSSGYWDEPGESLETVLESAVALDTPAANPVWVPFHSQMSAEGFATRLSQALDREFRVERRGAGAYQVVFDATDPGERDLVLDRISEITGQ